MVRIPHRDLFSNTVRIYNRRFIVGFTFNQMQPLNRYMGERRWPFINLRRGRSIKKWQVDIKEQIANGRGVADLTEAERIVLKGHNPGLNWLHDNLPEILADMYMMVDWKGPLNIPPRLLELMPDEQADSYSASNVMELFQAELDWIERPGIAISAKSLAMYFHCMNSKEDWIPVLRARTKKGGCSWRNHPVLRGKEYGDDEQTKPMRLWFYGDDSTRQPSGFAVCHRRVDYSGADWTLENGSLGNVRTNDKQMTEEQEALLGRGEDYEPEL